MKPRFPLTLLMTLRAIFAILLLVAITPASASEIRLIPTPAGGKLADATVDGNGVVHLAFMKDGNVLYTSSPDGGVTFATPLRVNGADGSAAGGMFRGPDITVGGDGTVHVVWYPNQSKLAKGDWGLRYANLRRGGNAFSPEINVSRVPGDNYSLAVEGASRVAAVWTAGGLFYALSQDGGKTFAPAVQVPGADPCECCATRALYAGPGELCILYRDKRNNARDMHLAHIGPGASLPVGLSAESWMLQACPMTGCSLTPTLAAWEARGKIYLTRLPQTGAPAPIQVGSGKYPSVKIGADGTAIVAWKNGTTLDWQLFDAQGAPRGTPGTAVCNNTDRTAAAITPSGKILLFQ